MSVEDLMHDDSLVIYSPATHPRGRLRLGGAALPNPMGPARGRGISAPSLPLPLSRLVKRRRMDALPDEKDEEPEKPEVW